jgi:serine/threonine protein kinase
VVFATFDSKTWLNTLWPVLTDPPLPLQACSLDAVRGDFCISLEGYTVADGRLALLLELADPKSHVSVAGRVLSGGSDLRWAAFVGQGLARGIQTVHAAGRIHRDVKPENLLLQHGAPKLADFGAAAVGKRVEGLVRNPSFCPRYLFGANEVPATLASQGSLVSVSRLKSSSSVLQTMVQLRNCGICSCFFSIAMSISCSFRYLALLRTVEIPVDLKLLSSSGWSDFCERRCAVKLQIAQLCFLVHRASPNLRMSLFLAGIHDGLPAPGGLLSKQSGLDGRHLRVWGRPVGYYHWELSDGRVQLPVCECLILYTLAVWIAAR